MAGEQFPHIAVSAFPQRERGIRIQDGSQPQYAVRDLLDNVMGLAGGTRELLSRSEILKESLWTRFQRCQFVIVFGPVVGNIARNLVVLSRTVGGTYGGERAIPQVSLRKELKEKAA